MSDEEHRGWGTEGPVQAPLKERSRTDYRLQNLEWMYGDASGNGLGQGEERRGPNSYLES